MAEMIVFPCAGRKNPRAACWEYGGKKVVFVARPELCHDSAEVIYQRPDDLVDNNDRTWRQELQSYNKRYKETGQNPLGLCRAWELYQPEEYELLVRSKFGERRVFILSAGWGLVRSDYLLPYYDITFASVDSRATYKRRRGEDIYDDFNQLADEDIGQDDEIYFFGLGSYFTLYYRLTHDLHGKKIIFHCSTIRNRGGYEYKRCLPPVGASRRRWHYAFVRRFV